MDDNHSRHPVQIRLSYPPGHNQNRERPEPTPQTPTRISTSNRNGPDRRATGDVGANVGADLVGLRIPPALLLPGRLADRSAAIARPDPPLFFRRLKAGALLDLRVLFVCICVWEKLGAGGLAKERGFGGCHGNLGLPRRIPPHRATPSGLRDR